MRRLLAGVLLAVTMSGTAAQAEPNELEGRWTRRGPKDAIVRMEFSPKGRFQMRSVSRENPDQFNMLVRGQWRQASPGALSLREDASKEKWTGFLSLREDGPKEKWTRVRYRVTDNGHTLVTEDIAEDGTPVGVKHRYSRR